ncbi:MAG: bacteriocin-like WGxF protein [Eubacteriaceae bacterium]
MNRIVGVSLLNCSLVLVTVLVHKIVYRILYLNYSSLVM